MYHFKGQGMNKKEKIAKTIVQAMYDADTASQERGMKIKTIRPDYAEVTMVVRADMLNGHKTCHGGMIFALGDSAFAFAVNTGNIATVAQGAQINFLKPAFENDLLTAKAAVTHQGGRTGLCDVTITNQKDETIAFFRGSSYRLKSQIIPDLEMD